MGTVRIILVGGFLGSGKTTLLWESAKRLMERGNRVGLITNDQAPGLVDTALLKGHGVAVEEVAGTCFCCDFNALIDRANELKHKIDADVLIAEPVGSCTDLSSTILQPLKDKFAQDFTVSCLSVLADPYRLRSVLTGEGSTLHKSAEYIFRKQLEEADLVLLNKSDLLSSREATELASLVGRILPAREIQGISALTGEGVDEWLDKVMASESGGERILDIDYDTYAEGEAALGWLNTLAKVSLRHDSSLSWQQYSHKIMESLQAEFQDLGVSVGHVKTLVIAGTDQCVANLTDTNGQISVRGEISPKAKQASLVVNARVEMDPAQLEELLLRILDETAADSVDVTIETTRNLVPGRPQPTYRYESVV